MALIVQLKPDERFVINGTLIRNGSRGCKLHIETHCRILRETEIIREEEIDTPCKQIWMTLQVIHLAEDPSEAHTLLLSQVAEITKRMPSSGPFVAAIMKALDDKQTHRALKEVKLLVQHERELGDGPAAHASEDRQAG